MAYEGPHPFLETSGGTGLTFTQPTVNISTTSSTSFAATSAVIPFDNTIPQISEGSQIMSFPYIAKNVNNLLFIRFQFWLSLVINSGSGPAAATVALFNAGSGGDANALYTNAYRNPHTANSFLTPFYGEFVRTADTLGILNFTIRIGPNASNFTAEVNGVSGQIYAGASVSFMQIMEIAP